VVDRDRGEVVYGVGGGVVWDSVAAVERRECELKARVLVVAPRDPRPDFDLLETLRWTPGEGFAHLPEHLERLAGSAEYFGFDLDLDAVRERLAAFSPPPPPGTGLLRIRLLVDRRGRARLEAAPLAAAEGDAAVRLGLAAEPVDPDDPFLYHKTTHRRRYDDALAARPDRDDVLLWNPRGEATESSTANLVVELDGELVTPPVACGLLPGTLRARLLAEGRIREGVVPVDDLARCAAVWLVSSLRGWRRAELAPWPAQARSVGATCPAGGSSSSASPEYTAGGPSV
jgi:para-aminobenzoate synthetase/4-amino-4-deoxychorismate lyase